MGYIWLSTLFLQRLWRIFVIDSRRCPFRWLIGWLWHIFDARRCSFQCLWRAFVVTSHICPFQRIIRWLSRILDLMSFYTCGHSSRHANSLRYVHCRTPFSGSRLRGCLPHPFTIIAFGGVYLKKFRFQIMGVWKDSVYYYLTSS